MVSAFDNDQNPDSFAELLLACLLPWEKRTGLDGLRARTTKMRRGDHASHAFESCLLEGIDAIEEVRVGKVQIRIESWRREVIPLIFVY